jgi:hypothetical protein
MQGVAGVRPVMLADVGLLILGYYLLKGMYSKINAQDGAWSLNLSGVACFGRTQQLGRVLGVEGHDRPLKAHSRRPTCFSPPISKICGSLIRSTFAVVHWYGRAGGFFSLSVQPRLVQAFGGSSLQHKNVQTGICTIQSNLSDPSSKFSLDKLEPELLYRRWRRKPLIFKACPVHVRSRTR